MSCLDCASGPHGEMSLRIDERLDVAIDAFPGRQSLCGAIRISRDGQLVLERAFGHASVQLGVPNKPKTRFHIASMTKMFISATVVRLVVDGSLSLEAHPSSYLPALSALDPRITLHQLLSHTSGLADVYDNNNLRLDMVALSSSGGSFLEYLLALPPRFQPGERWSYSSTGFLLLTFIVEAVTRSRFDDAVRDMFLTRLGMHDTGPDDPYRVNPGRAYGQSSASGGWRNTPNDRLAEIDAPREFYSTVADIDRWGIGVLDGEILDAQGLALTFSLHARIEPGSGFDSLGYGYGYGWFLGENFRWIGGMTAGFRAAMWQYPEERVNVVMLWNNERVDSHHLFRTLRPVLFG